MNMHNPMTKRRRFSLAFRSSAAGPLTASLVALLTLAACATTKGPEDALPERAQGRWDALLERDYDSAYQYLAPGYRSSVSRVDFEINWRSRRLKYESAEYRGHECEGDVCQVDIFVGFVAPKPVPGVPEFKSTSMIDERWIRANGEWWYLPEK